jgi:hypothetical protein
MVEEAFTQPESNPPQHGGEIAVMAAAAVVGLAYAAFALRRPRDEPADDDARGAALAGYLRDHLAGSDAALHTVAQLREGHRGTIEAALFARLHQELQDERRVVLRVLSRLGRSPLSLKRLAGQVAGVASRGVIKPAFDATLLRTLEALCIGIQGKRCLWRVLQRLETSLGLGEPGFDTLEGQALRQWTAVDAYRQTVALHAFGVCGDFSATSASGFGQNPL